MTDNPAKAPQPIHCPGCDEYGASHVVGTIEHPAEPIEVAPGEYARAEPTQVVCQCGHPRSVHVEEVGPCHNPAACFCAEFRYNVPADEFQEKAAAATGIGATPAPISEMEDYAEELREQWRTENAPYEWDEWILRSLRAVREERDRLEQMRAKAEEESQDAQDGAEVYLQNWVAERESRKQEAAAQFNAGVEAAALMILSGAAYSGYADIAEIHAKWIRSLSKPVQEPTGGSQQ